MCCRPSFKMLNRALLQVGQVWFGSIPKSAARATLLLVHLSNLHGGFSRSCLFSFVRGGASPLEDMCFLCAVLTSAGDINTVLTLAKVSTRISSNFGHRMFLESKTHKTSPRGNEMTREEQTCRKARADRQRPM